MDMPKSKKTDLQMEYEAYISEEDSEKDFTQESSSFLDEKKLQKEYEEYIKTEIAENNQVQSQKNTPKLLKKIILVFVLIIFLLLAFYATFIFVRLGSFSENINAENNNSSFANNLKSTALSLIPSQRKELLGEKEGRINILLLGAAGEKNAGKNLTDTIMIASIDTESRKIALLSLPRDLYVKIPASTVGKPQTNSSTKINGLYQYGLRNDTGTDAIRKSVEQVAGINIQYYLVVDYDGFVKFIDALGGINVNVERDIYDPRYPGPNYSYQTFELKKGLQKLDGETALKYVRERHDDPEGDFGRAKRQQQVMQSVKNKAFSIKTILNPLKINELLSQLEKNIKTNLTFDDIESILILSKDLDTQNISTKVVDAWKKDSLLKVSHVFYENIRAFILVPRAGNYSQIHDLAENIFDIEKIEKRKKEIEKEEAHILITNASGDKLIAKKIKELLSESFGIKNVEISSQEPLLKNEVTEVFDFTEKNKLFTLDEIIKSVPAKLSNKNAPLDFKKYDFVLVLGKDIVNSYKFEEADIEQFKSSQENQEYFEIKE